MWRKGKAEAVEMVGATDILFFSCQLSYILSFSLFSCLLSDLHMPPVTSVYLPIVCHYFAPRQGERTGSPTSNLSVCIKERHLSAIEHQTKLFNVVNIFHAPLSPHLTEKYFGYECQDVTVSTSGS